MKEIKEKITDPKWLKLYLELVNMELNNSVQLKKLNSRNHTVKKRTKENREYNCYAFVAYMNKWLTDLEWIEDYDMEDFLDDHTNIIKNYDEIVEGKTIVKFSTKSRDIIQHTAILVKFDSADILNSRVLHKPGALILELTTIRKCLAAGRYPNTKFEFRNPIT